MIPTLRALGGHVRAAAPDLPGFGRSDTPRRALRIPELSAALTDWMDEAGLASAVLLGNSMGCQIAVDLAVRHPPRVERAVLVGPTMEPAIRTPGRALWRLARDTFRESPSQPFLVAYDYAVFGPVRFWHTYQAAVAAPIEAQLPAMRAPALFVRGAHDPIATQPWVEALARITPHAQVATVPGAAHTVNYMAAEQLARLVLDFMRA